MAQQKARPVRGLYGACERGDPESVRSILADDVVWHEPDVGAITTATTAARRRCWG